MVIYEGNQLNILNVSLSYPVHVVRNNICIVWYSLTYF